MFTSAEHSFELVLIFQTCFAAEVLQQFAAVASRGYGVSPPIFTQAASFDRCRQKKLLNERAVAHAAFKRPQNSGELGPKFALSDCDFFTEF